MPLSISETRKFDRPSTIVILLKINDLHAIKDDDVLFAEAHSYVRPKIAIRRNFPSESNFSIDFGISLKRKADVRRALLSMV